MLWATNAAIQSLGEEALVSFDTVISRTNGSVTIEDGDQIKITEPGWYEIALRGVFTNATNAAVQAGVELLANAQSVPGGKATWMVPASGSTPAYISMPVHVIPAADGTATLEWQATDQITIKDVMLMVKRIV